MTSGSGGLHSVPSNYVTHDYNAAGASVTASLEKALAASQQMIADRLDLLRLDAAAAVRRAVGAIVLVEVGILLGFGAWFTAMAWLVSVSEAYASLPARLAFVALLNLALGIAAIVAGRGLLRADQSSENEVGHGE